MWAKYGLSNKAHRSEMFALRMAQCIFHCARRTTNASKMKFSETWGNTMEDFHAEPNVCGPGKTLAKYSLASDRKRYSYTAAIGCVFQCSERIVRHTELTFDEIKMAARFA